MTMTSKTLFLLILLSVFSTQLSAANIVIQNNDGPGEGFNDMTPATDVPDRAGNNPGATVGALRLNVFNEAASVLGAGLKSSITITIGATFDPLACSASSGTLGQAGATASAANGAGMAADTAYGISLAESLAGANLNGGSVEITAVFNSDIDDNDDCLGTGGFYYGLDGNNPTGTTALMPVVLHEISHGLGFQTLSDVGPAGSGGFIGAGQFPDSYSRNLKDQMTRKSWDEMNNAERKASAVNGPRLVWTGAKVTADRGMHLGPAPEFVINAPPGIADTYDTVLGDEPTIVIPAGGVTGGVIDGNTLMDINNDPADGCTQMGFGGTFTGKIVLYDDTPDCTAAFPAFFGEFDGAIAIVVIATTAGGLPDVSGQISNQEITIPYVGVTKAVGDALRANLGTANVTIRNSATDLLGTRAGRVMMYAPPVYETGSSVSHWDTSATPNLLMEPAINRDLGYLGLDLTPTAFEDIGWPQMSGTPDELDKPTNIRATDGTFSDRVRITFNTVAGATVYRVFRCLTTAGNACGSPIGFPKTGTFDDTKGVAGTVYYYRVRACDATSCSKFSVANTGFASAAPAKPTNIRATDGTFADRVRITFNTVAGATVYRVFRCLTTAGNTCGSPIGFPKAGTFDDTKGVPGTVYYYRVRACTATVCGKFSVANTGFSSAAPAKPTMVRATDGTFSDKVRITFNTVAGATVYRVFRCLTTAGNACGSPIGFPKTGVFDDRKGDSGIVYYYRVRACNSTKCGLFSAANTGYRGSLPGMKAGEGGDVVNASHHTTTAIPVLSGVLGRTVFLLMILGFGLVALRRIYPRGPGKVTGLD